MNSEKVISNIKKAIKEHLDNNYAYDMLVDYELDVIDWNSLFEYIDKLQQENKELKKQLEEINKMIEKCGFVNIEQVMLSYCGLIAQQKEFIKWLEDEIKRINPKELDIGELNLRLDDIKFTQYLIYKEVLRKYKSIIGCDKVE